MNGRIKMAFMLTDQIKKKKKEHEGKLCSKNTYVKCILGILHVFTVSAKTYQHLLFLYFKV